MLKKVVSWTLPIFGVVLFGLLFVGALVGVMMAPESDEVRQEREMALCSSYEQRIATGDDSASLLISKACATITVGKPTRGG